jgi:hypothetical protein
MKDVMGQCCCLLEVEGVQARTCDASVEAVINATSNCQPSLAPTRCCLPFGQGTLHSHNPFSHREVCLDLEPTCTRSMHVSRSTDNNPKARLRR